MKNQEEIYNVFNFSEYSALRFNKIIKYFPNKKFRLLDIGCGAGQFNDLLRKKQNNVDYYGLDVSKKQVNICKHKGYNCKQGDISIKNPYNLKFDVILASEVIEHIFDTDAFLLSCKSALSKNGIIILTTPNSASAGNRIRLFFFGRSDNFEYCARQNTSGHIRYFDRRAINELFIHNGLKIKTILGRNFNIPNSEKNNALMLIDNVLCLFFPTLSAGHIVIATK